MASHRSIVVLGGTGQLGTALVDRLRRSGTRFTAPARDELDLLSPGFEKVFEADPPAVVIHAAAYNDVNNAGVEAQRARAVRLNSEVPAILARSCLRLDIPLIHVSTDYVFDGRKRDPYREGDPTGPLQFYGRTKLDGERAVLDTHSGALVARTSTVFGRNRRGGSNYIAAVLAQARKTDVLEVVRPPVSSPTYATDLAEALLELFAVGATGLVHVANAGGCSRLELATEAVRVAGLAGRVEVRERPAPGGGVERPEYSVLDTSRFTGWTGRPLRPWQQAVSDYVATFG
jgi:dTDP-4-dehydrorhamnose reductase